MLGHRAEALVRSGDLAGAAADYRRAAELARAAGRPDVPAAILLGLGEIARFEGDLAEARRLLEAALRSAETGLFGAEGTRARVLTALGRLASAEGRPAEARLRHRWAVACALDSSLPVDLADAAEGLAGAALLEDAGGRAALLLGVAVALRGTVAAGDRDAARTAEAARRLTGAEAFAAEFSRGAALSHEAALSVLKEEAPTAAEEALPYQKAGGPAG
ncbi:tetratricopeptide repeat protein [Planomonospora sp. ID91781]|uniref:tetratricopeptide repeat protein n=1 Tax=Planomonospora sp. ID91781 TaxID=2738135 RepID=UPI0035A822CA